MSVGRKDVSSVPYPISLYSLAIISKRRQLATFWKASHFFFEGLNSLPTSSVHPWNTSGWLYPGMFQPSQSLTLTTYLFHGNDCCLTQLLSRQHVRISTEMTSSYPSTTASGGPEHAKPVLAGVGVLVADGSSRFMSCGSVASTTTSKLIFRSAREDTWSLEATINRS